MTQQPANVLADLAQLPDQTSYWGRYNGVWYVSNGDTTFFVSQQLNESEQQALIEAVLGPDFNKPVRFIVENIGS